MTVSSTKRNRYPSEADIKNPQVREQSEFVLPFLIILFFILVTAINPVHGQEKNLIQVKTFDLELNPIPNLSVSINGGEFILMDKKGVGIGLVGAVSFSGFNCQRFIRSL